MKAFIINLPRSAERRAHILSQVSSTSLRYELVPAVDGNTLTKDLKELAPTWYGGSPLTRNVLACALSHVLAYRRILDTGDAAAVVLEDDVIVPPSLGELAAELAPLLTSAEVVLFHLYSPVPPCLISRQARVKLSSGHWVSYPLDLGNTWAAGAYLITAEACHRMVANVPPVCAAADAWQYFYTHGFIDRVRCVSPLPVSINCRLPSTIVHPPVNRRDALYQRLDRLSFMPFQLALAWRRYRFYRRTSALAVVDEPSPLAMKLQ
jgi:glycosyl transferase family 25